MTNVHAFDREELMAYLDGELSGAAAESARAHLETCVECREMTAGFARVTGQFGEWRVEPAPADLSGRVVPPPSSTESSPARALGHWLRWPRLALVGAGAVVVLAVGFSLRPDRASPRIDHLQVVPETATDRARRAEEVQTLPQASSPVEAVQVPPLPAQPMVVRIVTLRLSTEKFDEARPSIEQLVAAHSGRIGSLSISGERNRRSLGATLRVPSARLDAFLAAVRPLGLVQHESISTEEVTSEYHDLSIRISTAKREEQRLIALLTNRTGKLSDVLEVERELARVRTEIERMDAALRARKDQVDYSSINLQVVEAYRAEIALAPVSVGARLRNAAIDGVQIATNGLIDVVLSIVQLTPTVLLWVLVLAWPVRALLRRARPWATHVRHACRAEVRGADEGGRRR
jgi:Domain of unknown function (DUF4349)/Putative zinc-finger